MRTWGRTRAASGEPGSHICYSFDDVATLRRAAVEFLGEGADRGDRLLYVADRASDEDLLEDLADLDDLERLLNCGTLTVHATGHVYEGESEFDGWQQVARYRALTADALRDGHRGLRVAADATELVRSTDARRRFVRYEFAVDRFIAAAPMAALCAYDRRVLGAGLEELCAVHPLHHGEDDHHAGFCLYHDGSALHLAGEVDFANHRVLAVALEAVRASDAAVLQLDLSGLEFVDVGGLFQLNRLVLDVRRHGRSVEVLGAPSVVRRCSEMLGFEALGPGSTP